MVSYYAIDSAGVFLQRPLREGLFVGAGKVVMVLKKY
jgi:hypothetical protein